MASLQDIQAALSAGQPQQGTVPVIDVAPYDSKLPQGQYGSQWAPSVIDPTAAGVPGQMPVPTENATSTKLEMMRAGAQGAIPVERDSNFPVKGDQKTGYLANIGAGATESIAGMLGLPVDVTTALLNHGASVLGLPPIQHPVGGTESFEKLFGLIGANPQNVAPDDQGERMARVASRGAVGVALPGGIASKVAKAVLPGAEVAPAIQTLAAGSGPGAAAAGAAGGVGGEVAREVAPEPYKPLAEIAGNVAGAIPVAATQAAGNAITRAAVNATKRALSPSARVPEIVGKTVVENVGGVPDVATAPIPSVPLDLAQATGSPAVASSLDTLNAMNNAARQEFRSAQNEQASNALMGKTADEPALHSPALAEGSEVPEVVATRGSTAATDATKSAAKIIATEENRLWNTPALSRPDISTAVSKKNVASEVSSLRADEPGLALAIDDSAALRRVLTELDSLPPKAAANQINAISSRFRRIARDPNESGDVRLVASRLASAAQEGLWNAPEVVGVAAPGIPTGLKTLQRHPVGGFMTMMPEMTGEIKPDPQLVKDLTAARAFTRREAETIGHASFDNILKRNSKGNETVVPGTAMDRFFDFTNGVERPGDIKNVSRFLDDIRQEWMKLKEADGKYDPATIAPVQQKLEDGARNYIFGKMMDAMTSGERDMSGNRMLQWRKAGEWLDTNRPMLERTGLFTRDQLDLLDRFRATAGLIQRGSDLGKVVGSQTFSRAMHPVRFVDLFTGPLAGRVMGAGAGAIMGTFLTRWLGEAAIGAMIGAEMSGTGHAASLMQAIYATPREKLMRALGEAYRNPEIARDLALRVSSPPKKPPSAATQAWVRSLLASQPGEVAGDVVATQAGQQ